eukprot:IDg10900t1
MTSHTVRTTRSAAPDTHSVQPISASQNPSLALDMGTYSATSSLLPAHRLRAQDASSKFEHSAFTAPRHSATRDGDKVAKSTLLLPYKHPSIKGVYLPR